MFIMQLVKSWLARSSEAWRVQCMLKPTIARDTAGRLPCLGAPPGSNAYAATAYKCTHKHTHLPFLVARVVVFVDGCAVTTVHATSAILKINLSKMARAEQ
jgi:hypothetical protein